MTRATRSSKPQFFQDTIAIVYDFDGTLSPQPMQEYTVLPKIGIEPAAFWKQVHREAVETHSEPMLGFMGPRMEKLYKNDDGKKRRDDFSAMAQKTEHLPGVESEF